LPLGPSLTALFRAVMTNYYKADARLSCAGTLLSAAGSLVEVAGGAWRVRDPRLSEGNQAFSRAVI